MPRFSLKYRIAAIIFVLEAVMMAVVLTTTLKFYFNANTRLAEKNETVLLNVLSDLARVALFNAEYDELQPYIEEVVSNPAVEKVMLLNHNRRVVVSSDLSDIGNLSPPLSNAESQYWREQKIANEAGDLGTLAINFSHQAFREANQKALDLGIVTALAGMIIIAVIGIIIGFLLTRRLDKLTEAAGQLAEGNLAVSADSRGYDEVAILGSAFNRMARNVEKLVENLRQRENELRVAYDDLEKRIGERTAELAVARDQALAANRTKSLFLANMSHELRTPLNAITGYSQLITEIAEEKNYNDIIDDLVNIQNAGQHLLGIINNVLDLSKIEAGKMEFSLSEFLISELVQEVVATVKPLVQANGNILEIQYEEDLGTMYADETKVTQILVNLIGNAAKFTNNGRITFAVRQQARNRLIEFVIEDTGIGISPQHMEKLFQEFSQVDPSATRKYGGTGLGLALSKRICELMSGEISVESQVEKGSKFVVVLPKRVVIAKESSVPVATDNDPLRRIQR